MAYLEERRKEGSVAELDSVDHKAHKEHVLHPLRHIDTLDTVADRVLSEGLQSIQDGKDSHD